MTLCENCANVDPLTRKREWYYWCCLRAHKVVPVQFVVEAPFLSEAPYHKCKTINHDGKCELFEMRKETEDANCR